MMIGEFKKMNANNFPAAGGGAGVGQYKIHHPLLTRQYSLCYHQ